MSLNNSGRESYKNLKAITNIVIHEIYTKCLKMSELYFSSKYELKNDAINLHRLLIFFNYYGHFMYCACNKAGIFTDSLNVTSI